MTVMYVRVHSYGGHTTYPDTVKPTCHYKVPVYVENALAKVKISV
jgi:hypothetical protein